MHNKNLKKTWYDEYMKNKSTERKRQKEEILKKVDERFKDDLYVKFIGHGYNILPEKIKQPKTFFEKWSCSKNKSFLKKELITILIDFQEKIDRYNDIVPEYIYKKNIFDILNHYWYQIKDLLILITNKFKKELID